MPFINEPMTAFFQITIVAIVFLNSCQFQPKPKEEGVIQLMGRSYDLSTQQYSKEDLLPYMNIWYNGNLVVEEIATIKETIDSNGYKKETPIAYYLFIDRSTKSFYHYSSFSDTACILDKYTLPDDSVMKGLGGWPFYKDFTFDSVGQSQYLKDTVINGNIYERIFFNVKENNKILPTVRYLRCDKTETIFSFNNSLRNKLGCPIVRIDYLPTIDNPQPNSSEIVFVRDKLLNEELKVFEAWEKNEKKYPVTKN
jgi:hypothetical protein